jgi:hypothetical protein
LIVRSGAFVVFALCGSAPGLVIRW